MIVVKELSKKFKSKAVLKNVSLDFKKESVTAIVGPNASGKTTFIKCLLGLVIPTSGEILIDGKKPEPTGMYRTQIGFMPQAPLFPPHLTPAEFLTMLEKLRGVPAPSRRELEEYFDLHPFLTSPFTSSPGERNRKSPR
jgi:Cu-processing system ATP-binding protein